MKNLIMLMVAIGCICTTSCNKEGTMPPAKQQSNTTAPAQIPWYNNGLRERDGGDDDGPIIMEITVSQAGNAISNSAVMWTNGSDTVTGSTNSSGECLCRLTRTGQWGLYINNSGYVCINTSMNIVDSFTLRRDTLVQGQCL